jgi:dipeptidyl aminopeptidase/acylaminoacyl peptidase
MYRNVELDVSGKLIRGTVRAPGEGRYPTIIFYHGFTMDRVGLRGLHEQFARECVKNGFACVRFDFYGLGESEGSFSDMTPTSEVEQAVAIYHWTQEQDFVDKDNLFITGHSLGGAVTAMTAPVVQPKAAVLWAPAMFLYLGTMQRIHETAGRVENGYDIGGIRLSDEYVDEARHLDIFHKAQGYDGSRVLLIQGMEDEQVAPESCYIYQDAYEGKLNLVELPGVDHQFTTIAWRNEVYRLSIDFLKKMTD